MKPSVEVLDAKAFVAKYPAVAWKTKYRGKQIFTAMFADAGFPIQANEKLCFFIAEGERFILKHRKEFNIEGKMVLLYIIKLGE